MSGASDMPIAYVTVLFLAATFAFSHGVEKWRQGERFVPILFFANGLVAALAWLTMAIVVFKGGQS